MGAFDRRIAGALIYETNKDSNATGIYTKAAQPVGTLNPAVAFLTPYVLASDVAGNVYVSDYSNSCVVEFLPAGAELSSFSAGQGNPGGLGLDPTGNLYMVDRSDGDILK